MKYKLLSYYTIGADLLTDKPQIVIIVNSRNPLTDEVIFSPINQKSTISSAG